MAIIKTKASQDTGVARVDEGASTEVRSTRDGAIFKTDWKQAFIMEGRGFMCNVGAFSTPISGGTVIDLDMPEFIVGVPTGTSILPLRIEVELLFTPGAADDDEIDILLSVDQDKMNVSSSGTSTAVTVYNMNTLHPRASNCYVRRNFSATCTDPVLDLELAHVTKVFELHSTAGVLWQGATMLYEPETLPIINGPAMLCGYYGGTLTTSGFACIQWIEVPTDSL